MSYKVKDAPSCFRPWHFVLGGYQKIPRLRVSVSSRTKGIYLSVWGSLSLLIFVVEELVFDVILNVSTLLREKKTDVMSAAKAQYQRRNQPAAHTGWGLSEIHLFMRWQFSEFKAGKISRRDLGGFSWKLPKKSDSGAPAPLPKHVVEYNAKLQSERLSAQNRRSSSRSSGSKSSQTTGSPSAAEEPEFVLKES